MKLTELLLIFLFTILENVYSRRCSRYPSNTFTPKSPVDENFGISITGNPQTYILGQSYNVSLHGYNGHRFVNAKLVLENENGENSVSGDLGQLEVVEPVETRYSQQCINMIESTNTNPKTKLNVVWRAPTESGKGCVLIRATVLQHRDVWFMDDGGLTKRVCEEVVDDMESQKKNAEETLCCACDEARYELIFEGLWSRNLHPKNFPTSGWVTRFTDIIGAAHTSDYRFWDKGVLASAEMQEFAEHGSTQGLEKEFNEYFREGKIRTVIKARGPAFPYITTPTIASVRVDPLHHQVSIASKIMPSPDWIVGVPGLELCLTDCTWLEKKIINLYPWDIGTDAGPSYTSPDQPQFPADVIRRMNSEYPSDPRSPFFDESHAPMKPLATLTIKRQRLYERKCEDEDSNNNDTIPRECYTHPWSAWTKCTAECGEGRQYRTRVYKQPDVAKIYNCNVMVKMRQDRMCQGEKCPGMTIEFDDTDNISDKEDEEQIFESAQPRIPVRAAITRAECRIGNWSPWSQCNVTCGNGMKERTREYVNPYIERECQEIFYLKLKEFKKCQGNNCLGHLENSFEDNEDYTDDNGAYRSPYKMYETLNNSPDYKVRKSFSNNQYNLKPQETFERDNDKENSEEQKNEYNFQTEDLTQASNEERITNKNKNSQSKETFNIRPAFQRGAPITNVQTQQNYITQYHSPFKIPPEYCHQPLNIIHNCFDQRVVGNFWFYNYCTDECMLFATDICDNNHNKFHSLEQCEEHCAKPMRSVRRYLRQKQAQGCRGTELNERNFKKRKYYYD